MKNKYKYKFTVFTPTFNRANLLDRLFNSLQEQTFKDFEWLIVDDGSTDNTKEVVEKYIEKAGFEIKYYWKENGGKHTAINYGVKHADGELFSIMDSDDWYTNNALERYIYHWNNIDLDSRDRYLGVCGHFKYQNGDMVGDAFPKDVIDMDDFDLKLKYKVDGDKISVIKTDIMKEFPFPEDLGRFVTEALVWNRMAVKYITRFVNEYFAFKEYQDGGLTDRGRIAHVTSPKASRLVNYELINSGKSLPIKTAYKCYVNFIRHSMHLNIGIKKQYSEVPNKIFYLLGLPVAKWLAYRDRRMMSNEEKNTN